MSLRLQIQTILINCLLSRISIDDTRFYEFSAGPKLLHRLRLVKLFFELLEGTFDIVSLFDLNA